MHRASIGGWQRLIICCLTLAPAAVNGAVLTGRVVDSAGSPVARAEVRVWQKLPAGPGLSNQQVMFEGGDVLLTDAEGRFVSPDALVGEAFARVVAEARGMLTGRSGWIEIGKEATVAAPDIALKRLRAILGKVVDRQGQPIAGVSVFSSGGGRERVEATSGQGGKLFLNGLPEGRVFLFAEKPGYRFTGIHLPAAERDAAFTLSATDEPVEPLATLPPPLSDGEQAALARKVLDPWLDDVAKSGGSSVSALLELADLDPVEAFNRSRVADIRPAKTRRFLELKILMNCVERRDLLSWDELRAVIESAEDRSWHSRAYAWAAMQMDRADQSRRRDWLTQALLHARRIEAPAERAESLVVAAVGLFDAGDEPQAAEIMAEAEKIAEQLPRRDQDSQQAFRLLAVNLAQRDPIRAMAWLERIEADNAYVKAGCDLAVKMLPDHPDAAEQTWRRTTDRMRGDWRRFHMGERGVKLADLCYRMAGVDRPRAERIARDTKVQPLRVRALGAIGLRLAESDPAAARKLLEAIVRDELPHPVLDDDFKPFGFGGLAAPLTAAWLLPIAEPIDPRLTHEIFWRSLALRRLISRREELDDEDAEADIALTMMLSRYDRGVARALLEPLVARLSEFGRPALTELKSRHAVALAMQCRGLERTVVAAAVHIDPLWAVDLYRGLPAGEIASLGSFQVVDALVATLSRRGADRWGQSGGFFSAFSANYWTPPAESASAAAK